MLLITRARFALPRAWSHAARAAQARWERRTLVAPPPLFAGFTVHLVLRGGKWSWTLPRRADAGVGPSPQVTGSRVRRCGGGGSLRGWPRSSRVEFLGRRLGVPSNRPRCYGDMCGEGGGTSVGIVEARLARKVGRWRLLPNVHPSVGRVTSRQPVWFCDCPRITFNTCSRALPPPPRYQFHLALRRA